MELFGSYTSPFVRHCRVALLTSNIQWSFLKVDGQASAKQSPTQKVPYLKDGDLFLTDSTSIIKYIREKSGMKFLDNIVLFDRFCLVNTLMDATVNLFMLERSGLDAHDNSYLQRQKSRTLSGLEELNRLDLSGELSNNDFLIRLACFLAWGCYRSRFDLTGLDNLAQFLMSANTEGYFVDTAPPSDG